MSRLKNIVLSLLPASVFHALRRARSCHTVRNIGLQDEPELLAVRRFVTKGSIAFDVGANIGIYTNALVNCVGSDGLVVSLEPIPSTFAVLAHNSTSLGWNNVMLLQAAASDSVRVTTMSVPSIGGGSNFYRASLGNKSGVSYKIVSLTLDGLPLPDVKVSFLKIDVEGFELPCIKGALEILRRDRPAMLIEVDGSMDEAGTSAAELLQLLTSLGYSAFVIKRDKIVPRIPNDCEVNYLFLQQEHYSNLPVG